MNEEQLRIFLRQIEKKWIKAVKTMVREIEMELFPYRREQLLRSPPTPYLNMKLEPSILDCSGSDQTDEDEIEEELNSCDSDKILSPSMLEKNTTPCCYSNNFRTTKEEDALNSYPGPSKLQRDDFTPSPINSCKRRVRKTLRFSSPDYNYSSFNLTNHSEISFAFSSPEQALDDSKMKYGGTGDEQGNKLQPCNDDLHDLLEDFVLNDADVWINANKQYTVDYSPALEVISEEVTPTASLLEFDYNSMHTNADNKTLNLTF